MKSPLLFSSSFQFTMDPLNHLLSGCRTVTSFKLQVATSKLPTSTFSSAICWVSRVR